MKVSTLLQDPKLVSDAVLVIPIFEDNIPTVLPKSLQDAIAAKDFKGELLEVISCYDPSYHAKRMFAVGLGKSDKLTLENLRRSFGMVEKFINKRRVTSCSLVIPKTKFSPSETVSAVLEGLLLSNYKFDKYKSDEKEKLVRLEKITLVGVSDVQKAIDKTLIICRGVNFTRDLVNENSKDKNALAVVDVVKQFSKILKLKLTILTEKDMKKLGMGLILAVNAGTPIPPRMVMVEYHGNAKSKDVYAIIGKGIIFDSGGLNLKSTGNIETMRTDMAGAATVLGVVRTAAELKLPVNIVAVAPLCENLVSGTSYKPNDTFRSLSGKTVEIGNTDAEGRLILADALTYTARKYKPKLMIDLATLTGVARLATGERIAPIMGTDEHAMKVLTESGKYCGEWVHELPLHEDYKELLKSQIADLSSTGNGKFNPGSITAGLFLQNFVEDRPWIHIDMAGPAYPTMIHPYLNTLASGYGVRLLINFFEKQ